SFPGLNQRQRFLIHDALKNPSLSCTFSAYQGKYHVTNPTARTDLLGLVRLGLLHQEKEGKRHIFRAAPNLRKILHLPPAAAKPEKEKPIKPIAVTTQRTPSDEPKTADAGRTEEKKRQRTLFDTE